MAGLFRPPCRSIRDLLGPGNNGTGIGVDDYTDGAGIADGTAEQTAAGSHPAPAVSSQASYIKTSAMPSLNIPDCEEISLEAGTEGETHGGRMGHETPREISAKLQIDSLTDDEGDDMF